MATKKNATKRTVAKKVKKPAPKKCATRTCHKKKEEKRDDKHKFIIFGLAVVLVILCGSLGAMTWARYATTVSGTASVSVAKWAVAVKNGSTTITGTSNTLTLTPSNSHTEVASGKIAPGSTATGAFTIDFTGTEVESEYTIAITMPQSLAATNAEINVTSSVGSPTCNPPSNNVVTCTGHLSLSQISSTPIVTVNAVVNWDDHGNYDASDDDATDTADGITAGSIQLGISISAKQAFDYSSN